MTAAQPITLFDRARLMLARHRAQRMGNSSHVLFDTIASDLQERLEGIRRPFLRVLDLGSRSFALARSLAKQNPARFIVHGASYAQPTPLLTQHSCAVDEEWLPFRDQSFDLVISTLSLHWVNDLPGTLAQIRRILKPDGLFLAALLGGSTLHELRQCLYEAELMVRGGVSPHISPFAGVEECGQLLSRAGFSLPAVDRDIITLTYPSSFALMHDLRNMGETNALLARDRRVMPRAVFMSCEKLYHDRFGNGQNVIPARFEIITLCGWAADASQQKPLLPGAAQNSLAKALRREEMTLDDVARNYVR